MGYFTCLFSLLCPGSLRANKKKEKAFFILQSEDGKIPQRATDGSAGHDIFSPIACIIPPHSTITIDLCIAIRPPLGCYTRTSCRSSLATEHNIMCPADVIDPDYTGSIHMILTNLSCVEYAVKKHERIGSLVFERTALNVEWQMVHSFQTTTRGSQGFGSTGKLGFQY